MRPPTFFKALTFALALCLPAALSCQGTPPPLTAAPSDKPENRTPLDPEVEARIFRVEGEQIKNGLGTPLLIHGIAFGNEVWDHVPLPSSHHSGKDFSRVRQMGMNAVRFYLSYRNFEDDDAPFRYKEDGWAWMDQNIEWAKKQGVLLILNMHDPAGGFQSNGGGDALWDDPKMSTRFVDLWRAIAERYRAEPTILGYDLLNEPAPSKSAEQWMQLAERTIKEIRAVDQHHMIFVERTSSVAGDYSENAAKNFFRVQDDNVVYEYHFYKPFHFTHQNAKWAPFAAQEGWYPDPNIPEADWFDLTTEKVAESEALPAGDSDWTLLETAPFVVSDDKLKVGKPSLVCDQGEGKVVFDTLSLTRIDRAAAIDRAAVVKGEPPPSETIFELDLDTLRGWYFWEQKPSGRADFVREGHGDQTALSISFTKGPANLGSDPLRFFLQQGSEYVLSGLAKGEGLGEKSRCLLRLEFSSSKAPIHSRGKDFLEQQLDAYLAWGKKEGVPLYLGEFGTIRDSFLPGRGGLLWVKDMLSLLLARDANFSYHAYHEQPFGLNVSPGLPTEYGVNLPLRDLFVEKLGGQLEAGAAQAYVAPSEAVLSPAGAPEASSDALDMD